MKFIEIFRFEFAYQIRRPWPWLCMAVLATFAFFSTRIAIIPVTLPQDFILNSPFIIASVTVFTCQVWLLLTPVVGGDAAARDVHTGMHPLVFTSPINRLEYLGGRVLAAFVLNALILLGVQLEVAERPDRAGIDPYNLLDWEEGDNIEKVNIN
jgi:ABC-2 type transport system permease protein